VFAGFTNLDGFFEMMHVSRVIPFLERQGEILPFAAQRKKVIPSVLDPAHAI
jgi:hypothetical protein